MKLKFFLFALFALALGLVRPASADIVYSVNIDTGSIKDSLGGLDYKLSFGLLSPVGRIALFPLLLGFLLAPLTLPRFVLGFNVETPADSWSGTLSLRPVGLASALL
jgi:hypothetical protein